MKVVVRVDASTEIGSGHVMRCLTLADGLCGEGAEVSFVCREHPGHLCDLIESRGFRTLRLPRAEAAVDLGSIAHAHWLGVSQADDARETRAAIEDDTPFDWLIVDHYGLDRDWETALRSCARQTLVIDDLADRNHECDFLLDQNLVAGRATRYAHKVGPDCVQLLGPEYALLQPVYRELHERIAPREGPVRRILIFFGNADSYNLASRVLAAFLRLGQPEVEVDLVVGQTGSEEAIRRQASGRSNIRVHRGLPTLAPLMAKADLAVGACGTTSWERLCLGLPTLAISLAENQRPLAEELSRLGLIRWIGHVDSVDDASMGEALGDLLAHNMDPDWSIRCSTVVDGRGLDRVCAILTVTSDTPLRIRRVGPEDESLLLAWANDPVTRMNAFAQDRIQADTHREWFVRRLGDIARFRLYILESEDGIPLGQVRFEKEADVWQIDYSLAPHFRRRGLGSRILETALAELRRSDAGSIVVGRVKDSNQTSRKVFESLGFESRPTTTGTIEYRRRL